MTMSALSLLKLRTTETLNLLGDKVNLDYSGPNGHIFSQNLDGNFGMYVVKEKLQVEGNCENRIGATYLGPSSADEAFDKMPKTSETGNLVSSVPDCSLPFAGGWKNQFGENGKAAAVDVGLANQRLKHAVEARAYQNQARERAFWALYGEVQGKEKSGGNRGVDHSWQGEGERIKPLWPLPHPVLNREKRLMNAPVVLKYRKGPGT
ncbi:hypothetical protein U1Q18_003397 [Sarracenia purpurea var. burkii]